MGADTFLIVAIAATTAVAGALLWGAHRLGLFKGERTVESSDEDADAFGTVVKVAAPLSVRQEGRIHFHGTTWPARASKGEAGVGDEVRIVDRENLVWIVEPLDPLQLNP